MYQSELNYCYNCMAKLESGQTVCPACGHDNTLHENPVDALPEGTILAGKYLIGKVLGQGGFGITYLGLDTSLDVKVAIKEYFPYGIGVRVPNSIRVTAVTYQGKAEGFRKGCDEFQAEAKRLAAIESPNIVKVRDYFRENGTAYIVMSFLDGNSLTKEVTACGGKMPWERVVDLFKPLIREMEKLHKAHLIHRDIKPDNIKVVKDDDGREQLVLLDFGAARSFVSAETTGTYSAMVTQGYAPVEQYSRKAHQGPYTDIYAICATMYAAITGTRPPQSNDRMMGLVELSAFTELGIDVPKDIEKAIFHGLEVRSEDRPQSMRELYDELEGKEPAGRDGSTVPEKKPAAEVKPVPQPEPKKKVRWVVPVLLAVLAAAGFFLYRGIRQSQQNTARAQTAIAETSAQIALELAARSTQDSQNTQTAQVGMTQQAAAAGTQTARETLAALSVQQTGTAWNLTAAAELQQTQTQDAIDTSATQAEQESRMEQTVQVETQAAQNTKAAIQSEQTTTAWFTTQEAQLHQTQTRAAEDLRETQAFFAMQTETQVVLASIQTETAAAEQTLAAQQTETRTAEEQGLTQTASAERTEVYEQTAAALEQTREALEQREAAFHVMETEASFAETQAAIDMWMTDIAATKTKAAEMTSTPTPEATLTPTMTNTLEPTATSVNQMVRVGEIITLGHYEQDRNVTNGAEAIEWQVLAVEDGRALVISRYGLDAKPYNEELESVTWETCTLREWLNGEFYDSAFRNEEKGLIRQVTLKNPENMEYGTKGGNDTTDRIFLLSIDEAKQYFANDETGKCWPTEYAKYHGASVLDTYEGRTWWWLRSPGRDVNYATNVNANGNIYDSGNYVIDNGVVVRPAFWLDLKEGADAILSNGSKSTEAAAPISTEKLTPMYTAELTANSTKILLNVGNIITLGRYEQDGDTANGAEAIEWEVLAVEEERALVISRYGLDTKPYNEKYDSVDWETCTLRTWLNGEFFNSVFSSAEKGQIREVRLRNPDSVRNGTVDGNDTTDRIFLLSVNETNQYFANDKARKCWPTEYAKKNESNVSVRYMGTTWWWLRSTGADERYAAIVTDDGFVSEFGEFANNNIGVTRPAFWLDLTGETDTTTVTNMEPEVTDTSETTEVSELVGITDDVKAGDIITLGWYEQDGNLSNGKEAIEWQVLAVEENRALVISKYGLDAKPYDEEMKGVTWETCTLRKWLNGGFYNSAFSSEEKKQIQEVRVKNPNNPIEGTKGGNDTTDRIFLLSIEEANQYFTSNVARKCRPTTYAKNNGAYTDKYRGGMTWWRLRSPGNDDIFAAFVDTDGSIDNYGHYVYLTAGALRPAFWLDLNEVTNNSEEPMVTETPMPSNTPTPDDEESTDTSQTIETSEFGFWVVSDTLLRDSPSNSGTVLRSILAGTDFTYNGTSREADGKTWIHIKTENGNEGWIDRTAARSKKYDSIPPKAGDFLTLGWYEQDNDLNNGPEAIEWQVLAVEDGRALVISKYGLEAKRYNEEFDSVTWETCTLRAWLNGEFYNNAFSSAEKGWIREVRLGNPDNAEYGTEGGNDTTDRIFLLSIDEAKRYFADYEALQCRSTTYVINNGTLVLGKNYQDMLSWWLRSPGMISFSAAYVFGIGFVTDFGSSVNDDSIVVRPAFWLKL